MEQNLKTAFVFPGQGSQSVGMLNSFKDVPVVQKILDEADETLGYPLSKLIENGPAEELSMTVNTQPALLTASWAMFSYWKEQGGEMPAVMAGHSLGEYSALVCAGALEFKDALKLVRFRAERMQEAVPAGKGTMAAVLGLSDEDVREACTEASKEGEVAEAVNFNTPGQVVIAGTVAGVEKASEICQAKGARRVLRLNVSGPFHSSLMAPAAEALKVMLDNIEMKVPLIPVIHNVDVSVRKDPAEIKDLLAKQAASAVMWQQTVKELASMGIEQIYECGPGNVLSGMVKRIDRNIKATALNSKEAIDAAIQEQRK